MKRAAAVGTLSFVVALEACGAARIVLTVDVLSFLRSQGLDTFSFGVRGGVPQTDLTAARQFSIPSRFGPGRVDSVQVTAGAILESTQGGGTVTLDVFFAKDEAGLFIGQPYVSAQARVGRADRYLAATDDAVGKRHRLQYTRRVGGGARPLRDRSRPGPGRPASRDRAAAAGRTARPRLLSPQPIILRTV